MTAITLRQYKQSEPLELSGAELSRLLADYGAQLDIRPTGDGRVTITGTNHVGVIRSGDLNLIVEPKVPTLSVFWMLGFVDRLLKFDSTDFPFDVEAGLVDLLARLFANQTEQVIRRGLYREYVERTENLRFVRGRIQLLEDARTNSGLRHSVVCRYAEITADVPHNRILRTITDQLLRFDYRLPGISRKLAWNEAHFGEVGRTALSERDFRAITYGRLSAHYRPVHALARLILRNLTFELEAGASPAPTFLLNMNDVYQEFLTRLIEERAALVGLRLRKATGLFLDRDERVRVKPDIVLTDGKTIRVAIDAKYKRHDPEADVYQALAYAKALGLRKVALVYPGDGEVPRATHRINHDEISVLVRTVPVGHLGHGFVGLEREAKRQMSLLLSELTDQADLQVVA